jgi:hypothetical protein
MVAQGHRATASRHTASANMLILDAGQMFLKFACPIQHVDPIDKISAFHSVRTFDTLAWIHEESEFKRPANGQHVLFGEDQFASPLPVATQLSFLVHPGHVIARIADDVQHAAILGRQWTV